MDNLTEQVKDAVDFVKSLPGASEAQGFIDSGVSAAVHELAKLTSVAAEATSEYVETGKAHSGILAERLREADEAFFTRPSSALARVVTEQPYAAAVAGGAALAMMIPGTRSLLWRASFGRFSSEEAVFKACQRRGLYFWFSMLLPAFPHRHESFSLPLSGLLLARRDHRLSATRNGQQRYADRDDVAPRRPRLPRAVSREASSPSFCSQP